MAHQRIFKVYTFQDTKQQLTSIEGFVSFLLIYLGIFVPFLYRPSDIISFFLLQKTHWFSISGPEFLIKDEADKRMTKTLQSFIQSVLFLVLLS